MHPRPLDVRTLACLTVILGSTARADVTLEVSPDVIDVGATVDLSLRLRANAGTTVTVAGINFAFDDGGAAWATLGPGGFAWVPAIMHDPGEWVINETLPDPLGAAIFPSAAITISPGGSVVFAELTVTPNEAGQLALETGLTLFNQFGVPWTVKGGNPMTITVNDPAGACCLPGGSCLDLTEPECTKLRGAYEGAGTTCGDVKCTVPCPEDLDGDEMVSTTDLLALLAAWATNPGGPPDFDEDGTVSTTDLLALLSAWGPCP